MGAKIAEMFLSDLSSELILVGRTNIAEMFLSDKPAVDYTGLASL